MALIKRSLGRATPSADSHLVEANSDTLVGQGGRYLASGDEAGTAPEDRRFRPDVEGLRAVAVLIVVLFHVFVTAIRALSREVTSGSTCFL